MRTFGLFMLVALMAVPALAKSQAPEKLTPELIAALAKGAQPLVVTVAKPFMIFHWTRRSDVQVAINGPVDYRDPKFQAYITRALKSFYNPHFRSYDIAGPGMYFAVDPIISRRFGGNSTWALFAMEVKAGTRYLNLSDDASQWVGNKGQISKPLQVKLENLGCGVTSYAELIATAQNDKCQAIRTALLSSKELNVQLLGYAWASPRELTICNPNQSSLAFLGYDIRAFNLANSGWMVSGLAENDPQYNQKLLIQNFFDLSKDWITKEEMELKTDPNPYPSLRGVKGTVDIESWVKNHTLACKN